MPVQRLNKTTWMTLACIVLTIALTLSLLLESERLTAILTNFGTFASLIGLAIVLLQIADIKETAELIRETAEETRARMLIFLTALDIARNIKTCQEIQTSNRAGKYELSILRMQELKAGLIEIQNNDKLRPHIRAQTLSRQISDLGGNIASVEKELFYNSKTLNIAELNDSLETVTHLLSDLYAKTKHLDLVK
jgi:hypothetical protein